MRLSRRGIVLFAGLLCLSAIAAKPAGQDRPEVNLLAVGDTAGDTPERAAEISRALAGAGIYVTKLVPIRHSLESFFMDVTGTDPTTGRGLS